MVTTELALLARSKELWKEENEDVSLFFRFPIVNKDVSTTVTSKKDNALAESGVKRLNGEWLGQGSRQPPGISVCEGCQSWQ
jgi:hypothetical protein